MVKEEGGKWRAYTWTLVVLRTPLGALGERKSDAAMSAAMAKATVVKYPKVFCARTREVYMVGDVCGIEGPFEDEDRWGLVEFGSSGFAGLAERYSHPVAHVVIGFVVLRVECNECVLMPHVRLISTTMPVVD